VTDKIYKVFNYFIELTPLRRCQTEETLLIGSHGYQPRSYIHLIQHFGMETEVAQHLVHNYGDRAFAVAAVASKTNQRWPLMGIRLAYPYNFIEAEVIYACEREYACTAIVSCETFVSLNCKMLTYVGCISAANTLSFP
jgi:glycerol-3-phosphate dehydrogenase